MVGVVGVVTGVGVAAVGVGVVGVVSVVGACMRGDDGVSGAGEDDNLAPPPILNNLINSATARRPGDPTATPPPFSPRPCRSGVEGESSKEGGIGCPLEVGDPLGLKVGVMAGCETPLFKGFGGFN